jgi:glucokinase
MGLSQPEAICLAGDIGGTKTRLLLARRDTNGREILFEQRYLSHEFRDFDLVLEEFLRAAARPNGVDAVCLGVAGPVLDDVVKVTNLPWRLGAAALRERLRAQVRLINDFDAIARGIDELGAGDLVCLQTGECAAQAPRLVMGAGTGLGISFSISMGESYQSIPTEAGRNAFAPTTPEQVELWRYLYAHHARATFELLLSGKGLMRIYDFVCLQRGAAHSADASIGAAPDPAAEIVQRGLDHQDELCSAAIDLFLQIYGARAGDLALTILARGGVYLAGGIAPKLLPRMQTGVFLDAFRDKGIHGKLLRTLPVHVVTSERVAVLGSLATAEALALAQARP